MNELTNKQTNILLSLFSRVAGDQVGSRSPGGYAEKRTFNWWNKCFLSQDPNGNDFRAEDYPRGSEMLLCCSQALCLLGTQEGRAEVSPAK